MPNKNIYSELQQGNLIDALVMLQTKVSSLGDWQLQQDLERVRDTYSTMLSYLAQGIEDPKAQSIRIDLIQQAYSVNDRANRAITLKKSPFNKYCQVYTQNKAEALDVPTTQVALETVGEEIKRLLSDIDQRESIRQHDLKAAVLQHDKLIGQLFNHTWTSDIWTKSDYTLYTQLMESKQLPADDKAIIISALTLACYELFDARKLMLLFDSYLHRDVEVSQRSLVGLILLIIRFDSRLNFYPQIKSRFTLYCENKQFIEDCFRILMQLQYSKMTDSVSAKMTQDIMPAILRSSRFKGIDLRNLDKELTKNGENPEWHQNTKDDTRAEKMMQQMTDMQTEGADVYWSSFVSLKGFAFFYQLHHWFAPFSFEYPESYQFAQSIRPEILQTVKTLFQLAPFCSSDKYSFIFMMDSVKQTGQELIANQINSQLNEEGSDIFEQIKPRVRKAKDVSRCYIFDLYRVFKAYPYHSELFDPFGKQLVNFSPLYFDTLKPLTDNYDDTLTLGEFMMRRGAYADALGLFHKLEPREREEDSDLWQKMGFCMQKNGDMMFALQMYRVAYKLNPNSKWTVQHLAQTAFEVKDFAEAEKHFDLLLADDEDNLKWLYKKAECMFGQGKYEESLPTLYKLAYLDEKTEKAQEMLAWGQLMTGNSEKAEKIHTELMEQNPSVRNNINLAHLNLKKGEVQNAYNFYAAAYKLAKNEDEFMKVFWEWRPYLEQIGLDAERMKLMLDSVRMNNN